MPCFITDETQRLPADRLATRLFQSTTTALDYAKVFYLFLNIKITSYKQSSMKEKKLVQQQKRRSRLQNSIIKQEPHITVDFNNTQLFFQPAIRILRRMGACGGLTYQKEKKTSPLV